MSPSLTGVDVLISFAAYSLVYLLVFSSGIVVIVRIVRSGPAAAEAESDEVIESGRPRGPVRALPTAKSGSVA